MALSIRKASVLLGVHPQTLRNWEREGKITPARTESNQRRYNIGELQGLLTKTNRVNVVYARVSTQKQKEDLQRQISFLKERFPNHEVISDIGSGINFKRSGLDRILAYACQGVIGEVAVAYKDRLARIGFDAIQKVVQLGGGKIVVANQRKFSSEQELVDDLLTITTSFSAKIYGHRKGRYTTNKCQDAQDTPSSDEEDEACH